MKKRLSIIVSLFLLVAFSMQALAFASIPVKSIKLNASTISIKEGQTYSLKATLNPSNTTQKTLTYSTANAKVATVDKTGKIKGIKAGKTVVTVTSTANKKLLAKCNVTVINLKPVKLRWYALGVKQPDQDLVMNDINKELLQKINATLDFRLVETGTFNDKMRMIIAANEDYDITFTSAGWMNDYLTFVARGAFKPLDELIDNYAPKLKTEIPAFLLDVAKVNNKIYAIPNYQIMYSSWGILVQKSLVDKYNLNINNVKTITDMYPFFEQIKKNEPGLIPCMGNGYPYDGEKAELDNVAPNTYIKIDKKPYKVEAYIGSSYEKKKFDLWHDMFIKGYFRNDMLTVTSEVPERNANKYASFIRVTKPGGDVEASTTQGMPYVQITIQEPFIGAVSGRSTMTAINNNSRKAETAIKLIELMNTDKSVFNKLVFGLEDIHYKKISQDTIEILPDTKYKLGMAWQFGNQFNALYTKGQVAGTWELTDKINRTAKVTPIRGFAFDQLPVANEAAKVSAITAEYSKMMYLPTGEYEKKYNEYVEKCKLAGLQRLVDEGQKQLDEWLRLNGKK